LSRSEKDFFFGRVHPSRRFDFVFGAEGEHPAVGQQYSSRSSAFHESRLEFAVAAIAWRNGIAVRTSLRMAEERTDALIELRADDVLELAGLRMHFGFIDREGVLEEALRKAMAADDISRALGSRRSELRFPILKVDKMQVRHAAQNLRGWLFGTKRETSRRPGRVETG
jgi:hypothetical protein